MCLFLVALAFMQHFDNECCTLSNYICNLSDVSQWSLLVVKIAVSSGYVAIILPSSISGKSTMKIV